MSNFFPINQDDTASVCLQLLARHGPRLMREGGGHLPQEQRHRVIPPEIKARVVELRRSGLTYAQIARATELSPSPIQKILTAAGLTDRSKNYHHAA